MTLPASIDRRPLKLITDMQSETCEYLKPNQDEHESKEWGMGGATGGNLKRKYVWVIGGLYHKYSSRVST